MDREEDIFYENDVRVLNSLTRVMRYLVVAFPCIYLVNLTGLFQIEADKLNVLAVAGCFLLWLPTVAQALHAGIHTRKYMCVLGLGVLVALLATDSNIGIYMTYGLAMVASLLFFDKRFTIKISIISYLLIVISLYFRSVGANHGEFENARIWWISRSLGFAIEAVCMTAVCVVLAHVSRQMMQRLDRARQEALIAEEKARRMDELQRAWNEAEEMRMQAEKANQAKIEFLNNMSHEIRTPLNAVIGMDELILQKSSDEEVREHAAKIRHYSHTLLSLLDEVLSFSHISEGKMEEHKEAYTMRGLINSLEEMMIRKTGEKGLNFRVIADPNLPDHWYGDVRAIRQVLVNILSNAVKFTDQGTVALKVHGEPMPEGKQRLHFAVADTGIGIREEDMDRLFKDFERLDMDKNRTLSGMGLGLVISRRLMDQMGGEIKVESAYGVGSTFEVILPQEVREGGLLGDYREEAKSGKTAGIPAEAGDRSRRTEERSGEEEDREPSFLEKRVLFKEFHFTWKNVLLMIFCVAVNYFGRMLATGLGMPLWLDSIGTVLSAVVLGPLGGMLTGAMLNILVGFTDFRSFWYMIVSMVIGFSVGYFFPRNNRRNVFDVIAAAVITGLIAAAVSTPMNMIFYNGYTGNAWGDALIDMLSKSINVRVLCGFLGECFVDMPDKTISFFAAISLLRLVDRTPGSPEEDKKKHGAGSALALLLGCGLLFGSYGMEARAEEDVADYSAEYETTKYDTSDGLAAMEINAIAQTNDGYMWVGTYSGVYRYDGARFMAMELDPRIRSAVALCVDGWGNLWIGTNDSGLAKYDPIRETVSFFTMEDGLPSDSIRCICEDVDGDIYVGTSGTMAKITTEGEVYVDPSWYEISYVRNLCITMEGLVAGVANNGEVFFLRENQIIGKEIYQGEEGVYYTSVACSPSGQIVLGTSTNLVQFCTFSRGEMTRGIEADTGRCGYANNIRYSDSEKGYFICGETGMGFLSPNGWFQDLTEEDFGSSVSDVKVDYQKNIWFVSNKQGILKYSRNPFVDIFKKAALPSSVVNALYRRDNDLFIGMDNGLVAVDVRTFEKKRYSWMGIFDGVRVRNIFEDRTGNLWVSTYGKDGLVCLDRFGKMHTLNEETAGTLGGRFRITTELPDGVVVAASNVGLNYIRGGKLIDTLGEEEGLTTSQILTMVVDESGDLLAGSDGGGIYRIRDGKVVDNIGKEQGLESLVVLRIVPCESGYFYVTSNALYYQENGEERVRRLENFPYSNNYDIYLTGQGEAWVSSSAGIYVVSQQDLIDDGEYRFTLLNNSRGFSTSLTANAWNCVLDGNLLLCCNDGVREVSLENYDRFSQDYNYDIRIEKVLCDDQICQGKAGVYAIPENTRRLRIQAAVLNYTLANPMVHIYLEGVDDTGILVNQSDVTAVSYTNLAYGRYTLHIQIMDGTGKEVLREETYTFIKDAQLFERGYFKMYLFTVCLIFVGFIAWLVARISNMALINRQYGEIRAAKEDAEQANRAKSDFLATISHEIRTPINAVIGMDELILKTTKEEKTREYAGHISQASHTLLSLINDILDLSKIESGHMSITEDEYSLGSLICDVTDMTAINAQKKGLHFETIMDEHLPDRLWGDMKKIRQILLNLLSNAVKYTREGRITMRVEEHGRDQEMVNLKISVQDTGIGVQQGDMDKLFEGYERLDEKKNYSIQGTGLGLSITKSITEQMGGSIEVESAYGKGSTFTVFLPQRILSEEETGDYRSHGEKAEEENNKRFVAEGARVLVVDDTEMNLIVFRERLKDTGMEILCVRSGAECLEAVRKQHFDVIFLDHFMPEMDGLETMEHLQHMGGDNLSGDTPVVALTANAVSGSREMYLGKGFAEYLSKPVEYDSLIQVLKQYVEYQEIEEEETMETKTEEKAMNNGEKVVASGEIDRETGLKYAAGDEEFFGQLLEVYRDQGSEKKQELESALAAEDWKRYVVAVHALKSNSKMVGAMALSEEALSLEMAGKEEKYDMIRQGHGHLMEHYDQVLKEVGNMLGNG